MRIKKKLVLLLTAVILVTSINVTPLTAFATNNSEGTADKPATASTKLTLVIHDWEYSVGTGENANKLTAKCKGTAHSSDSCYTTGATLTLTATSQVYSGNAVTADYGTGEATNWKTATTKDAPEITYEKKTDTNTWEAIASAPSAVGTYRAVAKFTNNSTDYTAYKEFAINPATISAAVSFTNPTVAAGAPATATNLAIADTENYTGAISWSPADSSFGYNKAYTATVTLSAKANYEFASNVTIPEGWGKSNTSTTSNLVLTKTYDATAKAKITSVTAPSVTTQLTAFTTEAEQLAALPISVTVEVEDNTTTSMAITWALKSETTYNTTSEGTNTFVWTITESKYENYDPNSQTLTGEVQIKNPKHNHTWGYSISDNVLTATCSGEGTCTVTNGKTTGVSLTLTANSATYTGEQYTGASYGENEADNWKNAIGTDAPQIQYQKKNGDNSWSTATSDKPTDIGTYKATITVEGKTAEVEFSINAASKGGGHSKTKNKEITTSSTKNGKVVVATEKAAPNTTVTIKVTPDVGYVADKVIVKDSSGNSINVKKIDDSTYTFKMPSDKVSVEATFTNQAYLEEDDEDDKDIQFVDVHKSDYYYEAVKWAVEKKITTGVDVKHFAPNDVTTRAQMVTFLWRMAGCPEPTSANYTFADIEKGSYYEKAVLWAIENGITNGTTDTLFSPEENCTRGQTVTFLCRYEGDHKVDTDNIFVDVADDSYYVDAIKWAVSKGITNGTSTENFSPEENCTRGQIVTFLYRDAIQ